MAHSPAPLSSGTEVRAADYPPSVFVESDAVIANISATTYTTGSPEVAARFVAPSSGRIAVNVSAGLRNNSAAADRVFHTFRIYEGDPGDNNLFHGEEIKYGVSNRGSIDANDDFVYGGHLTLVTGLTPGQYYYIQSRYRVTVGGGTADIAFRGILVFPVP